MLTRSRVGDSIDVADIDAVMSSSVAAVREMAQLGPALALPLLEFGLSVYQLQVELLRQLRPDVVLTCLQTAHGAVLTDGLMDAALHAVLGYAPRVVHCAAEDLAGVWRDMQARRRAAGGRRVEQRWDVTCGHAWQEIQPAVSRACLKCIPPAPEHSPPPPHFPAQAVADALGVPDKGRQLVEGQQRQLAAAADSARGRGSMRVACIQWPQPLMAAGAWVPELIQVGCSCCVCLVRTALCSAVGMGGSEAVPSEGKVGTCMTPSGRR